MEQLNIAENAKDQDRQNCGELEYENKVILDTPLIKRWDKENGWSYGIRGYRISNWYKTEKEVDDKVKKMDWNDVAGIVAAIVDATLKLNNLIK